MIMFVQSVGRLMERFQEVGFLVRFEADAVRRNSWLLVGASSFNEGVMPLAVVDCMELSNEKVFR
jgi:hypothetical protein